MTPLDPDPLYVEPDPEPPEPPRSGFALLWGCAALGIWLLIAALVVVKTVLGR